MDPYAFIVCAQICLIQTPTGGMTRAECVSRMEQSLEVSPAQRVMCQSLYPYGEIIDSAGKAKTRVNPWTEPGRGQADAR
jgi:hypothetical protein